MARIFRATRHSVEASERWGDGGGGGECGVVGVVCGV